MKYLIIIIKIFYLDLFFSHLAFYNNHDQERRVKDESN